jgi:glycosyltransferase involved in cell wall biosynthesis
MKLAHLTLTRFLHESRILKQLTSMQQAFAHVEQTVICQFAEVDRGIVPAKVLEIPSLSYKISVIRRISTLFAYLKMLFRQQPDVLFIHHTILLLPAMCFKLFYIKTILIYDAHELETERYGITQRQKIIIAIIEWFSLKIVNLTLVVSPNIKDVYEQKYPNAEIKLLPNSFPSNQQESVSNVNIRETFQIKPGQKILLHSGSITNSRGMEEIISVIKMLPKEKYVFVFLGDGPLRIELQRRTSGDSGCEVHFLDFVSLGNILGIVKQVDYGLCLIKSDCVSYEFSLPNKFFEYIYANVPPIIWPRSDMVSVLGSHWPLMDHTESSLGLANSIQNLSGTFEFQQDLLQIQQDWCWDRHFKKAILELDIK